MKQREEFEEGDGNLGVGYCPNCNAVHIRMITEEGDDKVITLDGKKAAEFAAMIAEAAGKCLPEEGAGAIYHEAGHA